MARKKIVRVDGTENLDEFKQKVAQIALDLAEEHDWCEVVETALVKRMGLGEFLPPRYVIQFRGVNAKTWRDYDNYGNGYRDKAEAISDAKENAVWERDNASRQQVKRSYLNYVVDGQFDLDRAVKQLTAAAEKAKAKPEAPTEFPRFRVVERKSGAPKNSSETVWESK